ncbi:MAG: hypothetical protein WCK40_07310 [Thermoleophilia bacterium]
MSDGAPGGFRTDLQGLLIQMAPPYGFTLATFTAGGLMAYEHGAPDPLEIFLLLAGAFLGYALLGMVTRSLRSLLVPQKVVMRGWQMLHVAPLSTVFLLAWASAVWVPAPFSWFITGIVLTMAYLGVLSAVIYWGVPADRVRRTDLGG